jgi:ATP-dependent DNA helicase RecQ
VVHDIEEQLGDAVLTIRGSLGRESLRLGVLNLPNSRDRLAWLLTHLSDLQGSGIIYTLTVSAAEDTARLLSEAGHHVLSYTGRTDPADRERAEQLLKDNEVKALVATSALGMGFDKPDLGFVVHLGAPSSPVAYYQQVGRAGRGAANADVLLLPGSEDRDIWQYFATASMPSEEKADAVLVALAEAGAAVSTVALEARVDLRRTPLELLLKVLSVDGAVERVAGGWRSTGMPWVYDGERYRRIAEARVDEQDSMVVFRTPRDAGWSSSPRFWTTQPLMPAAAATTALAAGSRRTSRPPRRKQPEPRSAARELPWNRGFSGQPAWTGSVFPSRERSGRMKTWPRVVSWPD